MSGILNTTGAVSGIIGTTSAPAVVLQIRSTTLTTETSYGSTGFEDTFMTYTITPKFSSSNILVYMHTLSGNNSASESHYSSFEVNRIITGGATTTLSGEWHGDRVYYGRVPIIINRADSPATTSEITYTLRIKRVTSSVNYLGLDSSNSFISLTEVAT